MEQKYTLSQLTSEIKDVLLEAFPTTVWLVAEISELKDNRSGHCYLELIEKDGNEIVARARATIWSYTYRMLKPYFETTTGQQFTFGIKILVKAAIEFHPAFGFSLNIKDIDPTYTLGDLAIQRKEIIDQLKQDGVFDMNKELELPLVPQKIAIISSATAAGYEDFINQLNTNDRGIKFYYKLFEAYMQGRDTVPSIINALERIYEFESFFDVVVIIRGGGATADLSSFDNYELSYHITQFPLPVITGIGHEKDDTIIDLVAHTRLKTPTAVAEFLINGVGTFYDQILEIENRVVEITHETIEFQQNKLERIAENLNFKVTHFITDKKNKLSNKSNKLQQKVNHYSYKKQHELNQLKNVFHWAIAVWHVETKNKIELKKRRLKNGVNETLLTRQSELLHIRDAVENNSRIYLYKEKKRIHLNENTVRLLNPENIINRGYTLTLKKGKIIKSVNLLELNDEIETRFTDGSVKSKIVIKNKNGS